jgi:hypothetical protein
VTLVSALLLVLAATGLFRLRPHALPPMLVGLYWLPSWLAQSFAVPLALISFGLAGWQICTVSTFTPGLVMAALAALFCVLVHLRNRRDGYAMLRQVGSAEQIPLLAGLWPFTCSMSSGQPVRQHPRCRC